MAVFNTHSRGTVVLMCASLKFGDIAMLCGVGTDVLVSRLFVWVHFWTNIFINSLYASGSQTFHGTAVHGCLITLWHGSDIYMEIM